MSTEQSKAYNPAAVEPEAIRLWTEERSYHAEPTDPGEPYAIVIPPPNVTAVLHMGHGLDNTLQDVLIRWRRMAGDNACWLPGTDHAGIATQTVVDKRLQATGQPALKDFKQMESRGEHGREKFVEKVQAWKDEYEQRIIDQLKRMGCSCDYDRQAFTMDEPRARAVREAFFQLFNDGLIYRGKRLVNWDPVTQTALADDEVEMEEVDGHFYYLKYPLTDGTGHVTVATTRPETMLGDTAVAVNPKDPRAHDLRGKHVRLPIVNREIPILEDEYVVMPAQYGGDPNDVKAQMATGFLKVTPAHDPNDYDIGQRHKLAAINVMAPDASISDKHGWTDIGDAGFLLGKSREDARKLVVEWFKGNGLLEDVKPYKHSVGHSYRSHVPIEPYLSDQWYCKVTDERLAGAALLAMGADQFEGSARARLSTEIGDAGRADWEGNLRFYPSRYAKTFQTWHENIRDWCISRQLWWGHRIPVWSKDGSVAWADDTRNAWSYIDDEGKRTYVCLRRDDSEFIASLESDGWVRDPDVLDTWFSSGLWPMSTLGWPEETPQLQRWNPTHTLCTAREIITLWVSRMVMFNLYFLDRLPFTEVSIHPMVQDGEGRKMSKSLGNGVDPLDIISSHGADAMRFTLANMTTQTQDVRMPVEKDPKTGKNTSPKFDIGRNFCNKLWNAARFALMNLEGATENTKDTERNKTEASSVPSVSSVAPSLPDRWVVSRFNRTVADCNAALKDYRFDQYAKTCYDFFWGDLCDWYLEAIKRAMKDPARATATSNVLASVVDGALRLLHPMVPFITEVLWWKLNEVRPQRGIAGQLECPPSKRLIKAAWPNTGASDDAAELVFTHLKEIIAALRNLRSEHKVDLKRTIMVTISAPADTARQVEENRELIELLATCQIKQIGQNLAAPTKAARTFAGGAEMFVEGMADEAAEQQRVAKRCEELKKQITALRGRLSNESYIKKAPPHLVQQTKDQLAEAEAELAKLE
jgi:valyl-tRNA synthetase